MRQDPAARYEVSQRLQRVSAGEDQRIDRAGLGSAPRFPARSSCQLLRPIGARLVFDMVYSPLRTRLLREAEAQGKQTISGMVMLVAQAARQFEIWTKHPAPQSVFEVESL